MRRTKSRADPRDGWGPIRPTTPRKKDATRSTGAQSGDVVSGGEHRKEGGEAVDIIVQGAHACMEGRCFIR